MAEFVKSLEELEDDGKFPLLSAKAAVGFKKTVQGELLREIERMEEQLDKEGKQLNGRQLYWLILQELKRSDMDHGGWIMEGGSWTVDHGR